jgi:hypothetical protein
MPLQLAHGCPGEPVSVWRTTNLLGVGVPLDGKLPWHLPVLAKRPRNNNLNNFAVGWALARLDLP